MKWALLEVALVRDWENGEYTNTVWIDLPCAEEEIKSQLLSLENHANEEIEEESVEEWEKNWDYDYEHDRYMVVDYETDRENEELLEISKDCDKDCDIFSLNREIKRGIDYLEEKGVLR